MAQRTLPGIGLTGFWVLGYDGWKAENDANLLKASALTMPVALSRVTTLPAGTQGQVYIVPVGGGANANRIAVYDNGGWTYFTASEGWTVYITDEDLLVRFDGATWGVYTPPIRYKVETVTTYTLLNSDLDGRTCLIFTNAGAITLNIPTGLTSLEPVMCVCESAGGVTNTASGTTLNAKVGLKAANGASWAIIPRGSNTFRLVGDLIA